MTAGRRPAGEAAAPGASGSAASGSAARGAAVPAASEAPVQESKATEERILALRRTAMSEKDSRGGGRAFTRLEAAATTFGGSADPEAASEQRHTVSHGVWGGSKLGGLRGGVGIKGEPGAGGSEVKAESAAASESAGSAPSSGVVVAAEADEDEEDEPELTFADALAAESDRFRPVMLPLPDRDGGVPDVSDAALVGGGEGGPSFERLPPVGRPPAAAIAETDASVGGLAREVLLLQFPPTMPFYVPKGGSRIRAGGAAPGPDGTARGAAPRAATPPPGAAGVKSEPVDLAASDGSDGQARGGEPSVAEAFDLARVAVKREGATAAAPRRALRDPAPARLRDLPSGRLGKLLVFESGAVKLRLEGSGVLLDLAESVPVVYRSDVVAAAPSGGHAVAVARIARRLVVTPDLQALLEPADAVTKWPKAGGEDEDMDEREEDDEEDAEAEDEVVIEDDDNDAIKSEALA